MPFHLSRGWPHLPLMHLFTQPANALARLHASHTQCARAQELGTYCGYSTVLLASHLRDPAGRVYTVDILEENVAVARGIIGHAGLSDRVVHVVKPLAAGLEVRGTECAACRQAAARARWSGP